MLYQYGIGTGQDSMEAVASHRRYFHMNLHLYAKRSNFTLLHIIIILHRGFLDEEYRLVSVPDAAYPSI